jgi:hypothetical protein
MTADDRHEETMSSPREQASDAPVDGAVLFAQVAEAIRRYVVVRADALVAIVLWVFHTHALEATGRTPYLHIRSATPRCGKSRLFDVLEHLVARPLRTEQISAAALARLIHAQRPTLLLDEMDQAMRGGEEYRSAITATLNSGIRDGGVRVVLQRSKGAFAPEELSTFCPKALAGIGELPGTVADRCIPIEMKRRLPDEPVERFYEDTACPELRVLAENVARWAEQNLRLLSEARPEPLQKLNDRADEAWQPLFAIAEQLSDAIGNDARDAAAVLMVDQLVENDDYGVALLHEIHKLFKQTESDRLSTNDLLTRLARSRASAWHHWWDRYEKAPAAGAAGDLAKRLATFGVKPGTIRIGTGTIKGYQRRNFLEVWERYGTGERPAGHEDLAHDDEDGE